MVSFFFRIVLHIDTDVFFFLAKHGFCLTHQKRSFRGSNSSCFSFYLFVCLFVCLFFGDAGQNHTNVMLDKTKNVLYYDVRIHYTALEGVNLRHMLYICSAKKRLI